MTTVLATTSPLMMLTDSQTNDGGKLAHGVFPKLEEVYWSVSEDCLFAVEYGQRALVGYAGEVQHGYAFLSWARNGFLVQQKPHFDKDAEFTGLMLTEKSYIFLFNDTCFPIEVYADHYAIGTGRNFVYGALAAGASPVRAVEIAASLDLYSGLPICVLELKG